MSYASSPCMHVQALLHCVLEVCPGTTGVAKFHIHLAGCQVMPIPTTASSFPTRAHYRLLHSLPCTETPGDVTSYCSLFAMLLWVCLFRRLHLLNGPIQSWVCMFDLCNLYFGKVTCRLYRWACMDGGQLVHVKKHMDIQSPCTVRQSNAIKAVQPMAEACKTCMASYKPKVLQLSHHSFLCTQALLLQHGTRQCKQQCRAIPTAADAACRPHTSCH